MPTHVDLRLWTRSPALTSSHQPAFTIPLILMYARSQLIHLPAASSRSTPNSSCSATGMPRLRVSWPFGADWYGNRRNMPLAVQLLPGRGLVFLGPAARSTCPFMPAALLHRQTPLRSQPVDTAHPAAALVRSGLLGRMSPNRQSEFAPPSLRTPPKPLRLWRGCGGSELRKPGPSGTLARPSLLTALLALGGMHLLLR